jgi:hypothetical protein
LKKETLAYMFRLIEYFENMYQDSSVNKISGYRHDWDMRGEDFSFCYCIQTWAHPISYPVSTEFNFDLLILQQ